MPVPQDWPQQLSEFVKGMKQLDGLDREFYLGNNPLSKFEYTESAQSWDEFLLWLNELQGSWCFRGQRESSWSLTTSLDRAVKVEFSDSRGHGYYHLERESTQRELLFRFQQQAHHHIHPLPGKDDIASWLALMQHYGVPTRLLDWSKSPYVALHFALVDDPQEMEESAALWAIDINFSVKRGQVFFDNNRPP